MSSTHGSETEGSAPSAGRGVWGFMKRKVWGDVPSHPISDSGSDSRAVSPDPAVGPAEMSAPKAASPPEESGTQSPFQGHNQSGHDSQSDEDAPENLQAGTSSGSNRAAAMASEPSLRHGLGEGKRKIGRNTKTGNCLAVLQSNQWHRAHQFQVEVNIQACFT